MKAYLLLGVIACAITFLVTPLVRRISLALHVLTPVRGRDVHTVPTPRLGGIAMLAGLLGAFLIARQTPYFSQFYSDPQVWALIFGSLAIAVLGIIDDIYDLNWWTKLSGQVLIAAGIAWQGIQIVSFPIFGMTIPSTRMSILVTVLIIVVSTNAVNFVDGLDGLAAGITLIGAGAFFVYSYLLIRLTNAQSYASFAAMIGIVIVGVCLGFLTSNFHPAKIFMGDSGSMLLGLTTSCMFIVVTGQTDPASLGRSQFLPAAIPVLLPIAVMILPFLDMVMAVIRRLSRGQSPFKPDRQHLHHRLLKMGHSHRRAVMVMYLWAFFISLLAVSFLKLSPLGELLLACGGGVLCFLVTIAFLPGLRSDYFAASGPYPRHQRQKEDL
ncbi:glycosyltransferase family 4 protein [uncultured Varibaculum sp.]|uniref:glycosyltransferase family 4 protein n=1 Tax=uncultured Varibaculum sp. TaxID=413896 RepID=UPI002593FC4C|nr:MraY family glycosyltransferase [uncultured Varibaculum sp.]